MSEFSKVAPFPPVPAPRPRIPRVPRVPRAVRDALVADQLLLKNALTDNLSLLLDAMGYQSTDGSFYTWVALFQKLLQNIHGLEWAEFLSKFPVGATRRHFGRYDKDPIYPFVSRLRDAVDEVQTQPDPTEQDDFSDPAYEALHAIRVWVLVLQGRF